MRQRRPAINQNGMACVRVKDDAAPLELPPVGELDPPLLPPLLPVGGVGTNVPLGAPARQAFAAEDAAALDAGPLGLTVAFPAKLHVWGSRLLSS